MSADDNSEIDDAVFALLRERVDTFEKLELVMTMGRSPYTSWTLEALESALRVPRAELVPAIDQLRAAGVLRRVPGATYQLLYNPIAEIAPACTRLCRAYDRERTGVTRLLREIEVARATRSSADAFANAFRIRKPVTEDSDE